MEQHAGRAADRPGYAGKIERPGGAGTAGKAHDPRSRSEALSKNFAEQWLGVRVVLDARPDVSIYPDFDDNLAQSMLRETDLFFNSIVRENRNILDLLTANYTFVNERLARHYGIPNVAGAVSGGSLSPIRTGLVCWERPAF